MRTGRLLLMVIIGAVGLAACAGDSTSGTVEATGDTIAAGATETTRTASDEAAVGEGLTDTAPSDRKVIRTGQIEILASDTRTAMDRITAMVEASGGYVASSSVSPAGGDRQPFVSLTIRVPAEGLNNSLAAIREIADEVVSESIDSQDVTEEYVDVESRLRNLNALEIELVALLAEVREQPEADPQKLLQVFNEISNTRSQIEVLEGRRRLIDNQTALSTITVDISAPAIDDPIVEDGWQPLVTVRRAAGNLVETLQSLADAALWFVIYAVPILLLVGIPLWLVMRFARRRSARTPVPPPPPPPPPPTPVAADAEHGDTTSAGG
jgi:hypothetical protein